MHHADTTYNFHGGNAQSAIAFETVQPHVEGMIQHILKLADARATITKRDVETQLGMLHQTASARLTDCKARGWLDVLMIDGKPARRDGCTVLQITSSGKQALRA